jgi:hypothetical protein
MSRNAWLRQVNPVGRFGESSRIDYLQPGAEPRQFKIHDVVPSVHRLVGLGCNCTNGALVLGAKAVSLGRAYACPLLAAGEPGVQRILDTSAGSLRL